MPIATIKTRHKNQHIEAIILNGKKIGYVEKLQHGWQAGDWVKKATHGWYYYVCSDPAKGTVTIQTFGDKWEAIKAFCLMRQICYVKI